MNDHQRRPVNFINVGFGAGFLIAAAVLLAARASLIDLDSSIVAPIVLLVVGVLLLARGVAARNG
jgi:hypothetical protein